MKEEEDEEEEKNIYITYEKTGTNIYQDVRSEIYLLTIIEQCQIVLIQFTVLRFYMLNLVNNLYVSLYLAYFIKMCS